MQFSLPVLPFDPAIAKAAPGNTVSASRSADANPQLTGAAFVDLLPADPQRVPNLNSADGKSLGFGLSKRSTQKLGEPQDDPLDESDDDGQSCDTDTASENWAMVSSLPPRFVANLPITQDEPNPADEATTSESPINESATTEEPAAGSTEGAEIISGDEVAGGKAVGLTQPMPAKAQGDGRARAILHRAERTSPVLIRNARDATASNELPDGTSDQTTESTLAPTETDKQVSDSSDGEEPAVAGGVAGDVNAAVSAMSADALAASQSTATVLPVRPESQESPVPVTQSSTVANGLTRPMAQEPTTAIETPDSVISSEFRRDTASSQEFAIGTAPDSSVQQTQPDRGENLSSFDSAIIDSQNPTALPRDESLPVQAPSIASVGEEVAASAPVATELGQPTPLSRRGSDGASGKMFPGIGIEISGTAIGLDIAAEKFAGGFDRTRSLAGSRENRTEIKSVSSDFEQLTNKLNHLGINVADSGLSMAAPATSPNTSSTLPGVETMSAVSAASGSGSAHGDDVLRGASASAAQRAVESAVAIAEHFSTGERRSVNLQFTVSGVDLAVRVELRGAEVHTTFRTDSPELRAALAHEWQVVTAQPADRAMRLADPVFASSSNNASAQADVGSHQQRDNGTRGSQFENNSFAGFRSPNRSSSPAMPRATTIIQEADLAVGRLRTFA